MTHEESILLLGNVAKKFDALASAFFETQRAESEKKEREKKEKTDKKKEPKDKLITKKTTKPELKISEPAKTFKVLVEKEKETKEKGSFDLREKAPKLADTLTSTERKRWENIGTILGTAFKKIFEGREKVKREFDPIEKIMDMDFKKTDLVAEIKKSGWFKRILMLLTALGALAIGFLVGFIKQITDIFKFLYKILQSSKIPELLKMVTGFFKNKLLQLLKIISETKIGRFLTSVFEALKSKFLNLLKIIGETKISQIFPNIFKAIKSNFLKLFEMIKSSKLAETALKLFESVKGKFLSLIKIVQESKLGTFVSSLFESVKSKFLSLIKIVQESKLGTFVSSLFESVKSKFLSLIKIVQESKLGQYAFQIFESVKSKFLSLISAIKELKISTVTGIVGRIFEQIFSKFKSIFNLENITKVFSNFKTKFLQIFENLFSGVSKISSFLSKFSLFQKFLTFFSPILKVAKVVFKIGEFIGRRLGFAVFVIIDTFVGLFKAFTDPLLKGKSMLQKLLTAVTFGITNILNIFSFIGLKLTDFDEIRDRVDKVFSSFKDGFFKGMFELINQVITFVSGIGLKMGAWIVGWFDKEWKDALYDIAKNAKNPWDQFVKWTKLTFSKLSEYILKPFKFIWEKIKSIFSFDIKPILTNLKNIVMFIPNFIGDIYNNINNFFRNLDITGAIAGVKSIVMFFPNFIGNLYNNIKNFFGSLDISGILDGLKSIVSFPANFVGNLYNNIKNFFGSLDISGVLDTLKSIVAFPANFVGNLYNNIKNFFGGLNFDGILNYLNSIVNFIPEFLGNITNYIKIFFEKFNFNSIMNGIKNMFDYTPFGILLNNFDNIKNFFGNILSNIAGFFTFVQEKVDGIFGTVMSFINSILKFINDKVKKIPFIGKYFESDDEEKTFVTKREEKIPTTKNIFVKKEAVAGSEFPSYAQSYSEIQPKTKPTIQPVFEAPSMITEQGPESVYTQEKKSLEPQNFNKVEKELQGLNKNSSVNSKIAVDQLREIQTLNKKFQELSEQMAGNRNVVVNNVSNRSVNAFLQASSINNFRSAFREA